MCHIRCTLPMTSHAHKEIPVNMNVIGKVGAEQLWLNIQDVKKSGTKAISILKFEPSDDYQQAAYDKLFSLINKRDNLLVVDSSGKNIKYFMILSLASHNKIPHDLLPFDGPGLGENRSDLLLAVIVGKNQKRRNTSETTENESTNPKKCRPDKERDEENKDNLITSTTGATPVKQITHQIPTSPRETDEDDNAHVRNSNSNTWSLADVDSYVASFFGHNLDTSTENFQANSTDFGRESLGSKTTEVQEKNTKSTNEGHSQERDVKGPFIGQVGGKDNFRSYTRAGEGNITIGPCTNLSPRRDIARSYTSFASKGDTAFFNTSVQRRDYGNAPRGNNLVSALSRTGSATTESFDTHVKSFQGIYNPEKQNNDVSHMNYWTSFFSRNASLAYADNSFNRKYGRVGLLRGTAPVSKPKSPRKRKVDSSEWYKLMYYFLIGGLIFVIIYKMLSFFRI